MPTNPPDDFRERAFRFTCKLYDYCDDLARSPGPSRRLANQLFDRQLDRREPRGVTICARRKDLAAKTAISLKESHETKYWLRVANTKSLGDETLRGWLLQESDEFVAMLTVSVRRLQTEPDPRL